MSEITKEEFSENIKRYQLELYRFAFSISKTEDKAQEIVQKAIVGAFKGRGTLRKPEEFKSWMMQRVADESKQIFKTIKRLGHVEDRKAYQDKSKADCGLWDFIMQLDDNVRPILVLFYYDNYSTKEIGKMIRRPEWVVESRLSGAREKLKTFIS